MDYLDESEAAEPFLPEEVVEIRREAEASYRGPSWIRWAVGMTLFFSAGTVAFGVMKVPSTSNTDTTPPPVQPPSVTAISVGSMPLTISAHYPLQSPSDAGAHLAVIGQKFYQARLSQPVNGWPTIHLSVAAFAESGAAFDKVLVPAGKIEMLPPLGTNAGKSSVNWSVKSWDLWALKQWIIAEVDWQGDTSKDTQVQLYAMYVPTHKYSMFRTLSPSATTGSYAVTAADQEVAIVGLPSAPRPSGTKTKKAPKRKSDIEIDTLGGTSPSQPVVSEQHYAVPQMVGSPLLAPGGLVYQGGGASSASAHWFLLNTTGKTSAVTAVGGDTADGFAHSAVVGSHGSLYAVEAVPSSDTPSLKVVRMTALGSGSGNGVGESTALPALVRDLTVSNGSLVWTQEVNHQWMLVIGTVNGVSTSTS